MAGTASSPPLSWLLRIAVVCAFALPTSAWAQPQPDAGLVDGIDILKLYRAGSPRTYEAIDALTQRLPPEQRQQAQNSDWVERTFQKTNDQRDEAYASSSNLVISTLVGPVPVDREKLKRAVNSMVQFLPQQPEFASLLKSLRNSAPEQYRGQIDSAIDAFSPPEDASADANLGFMERLAAQAERMRKESERALARIAIASTAANAIMDAIERHSEGDPNGATEEARRGLRQRVLDSGFGTVYIEDVPKLREAARNVEALIVQELARQGSAAVQAAKKAKEEAERRAAAAREEEQRRAACAAVDGILDAALPDFHAGRVDPYRIGLRQAAEALETAGGSDACPEQHSRIEKGKSDANTLANVTSYTQQVIAACDAGQVRDLANNLAGRTHPFVQQLHARVGRVMAAQAAVNEAGGALLVGQNERAKSLYVQAAAQLSAEPGACPGLHERIRKGLSEIASAKKPTSGPTTLAEMETLCRGMLGEAGTAVPDPSLATGYSCDCIKPFEREGIVCAKPPDQGQRLAAADQACKNTFGSASYARLGNAGPESDRCHCTSGHNWNQQQTQCVRAKREDVIAGAHRACQRANNNRRARASRYLGNGQWSCVVLAPRGQRQRRPQYSQGGGYDPAAAAAAAAAASVFIQGLGVLMNQRRVGGGGGRRPHCHRGPDGRLHCGAN